MYIYKHIHTCIRDREKKRQSESERARERYHYAVMALPWCACKECRDVLCSPGSNHAEAHNGLDWMDRSPQILLIIDQMLAFFPREASLMQSTKPRPFSRVVS